MMLSLILQARVETRDAKNLHSVIDLGKAQLPFLANNRSQIQVSFCVRLLSWTNRCTDNTTTALIIHTHNRWCGCAHDFFISLPKMNVDQKWEIILLSIRQWAPHKRPFNLMLDAAMYHSTNLKDCPKFVWNLLRFCQDMEVPRKFLKFFCFKNRARLLVYYIQTTFDIKIMYLLQTNFS